MAGTGSGSFSGTDITGTGASKYKCDPLTYTACTSPALGKGTSCGVGLWSRCECPSTYTWDESNCASTDSWVLGGGSCTSWPSNQTKWASCTCSNQPAGVPCDTTQGYGCDQYGEACHPSTGGAAQWRYCTKCSCHGGGYNCSGGQSCDHGTYCDGSCKGPCTNPPPSSCGDAGYYPYASSCTGNTTATPHTVTLASGTTTTCYSCGAIQCDTGCQYTPSDCLAAGLSYTACSNESVCKGKCEGTVPKAKCTINLSSCAKNSNNTCVYYCNEGQLSDNACTKCN